MTLERLRVLLSGTPIGWLERKHGSVDPTFMYDADYARQGTVVLSARLPLTTITHPAKRVAPYLQGLLPESEATRQRWAIRIGTNADDPFGMLASMGWDCPGAVQFCLPEDIDQLVSREGEHVEVSEADIARRLRDLRQDPASWTLPAEHWSLGGQQEKFALANIDGRWHEAHGSAATTHIIKPGIRHLQSQALVEHATMAAAFALGLDIAESTFVSFEDEWAIVIERFDRFTTPDGRIGRLHQEDFCQALGSLPSAKYEQRGGPSLADLVRVIRQESTQQESDVLALADFLIINVVAGAPDGHSKNISLLRSAGATWVAPLYDLATGLVYDSKVVDRSVAVSVGGERSVARILRRQWEKASATLGLPADALIARTSQLARGFPAAFDAAISPMIGAPDAEAVLERASNNLTQHCERILAQLG